MLTKKEKCVLKTINENCLNKNACLLSADEIISMLTIKLSGEELLEILKLLEQMDYLDFITTKNKDKIVYCITLHYKGIYYKNEKIREINMLRWRIILATICACVSFIVGRILYLIFT